MRKYILLITISLALIATIILVGVFFAPTSYTEPTRSTASQDQAINSALQISTINSTTEPEFFTFGDELGQAIFVELSAAQQENQPENYTLIVASVEFEMQPDSSSHKICSEAGSPVVTPPPGTLTSLNEKTKISPYLDRLAQLFDLPINNQYIITMWHPNTQSDEYVLVSGEANDTGMCPNLLDKDV